MQLSLLYVVTLRFRLDSIAMFESFDRRYSKRTKLLSCAGKETQPEGYH